MNRKEKELEMWRQWKSTKSNKDLKPLLKSIEPIITVHTNKLAGNLPRSAIRAQATKLAIDAMDKYDPDKSQLNTHLYSSLRKLNRYVYEHQNIGTIPEPRIVQIGTFNKVKTNMEEQLGRTPTTSELADELKWSPKQVDLLQKELRHDLVHDFSYGLAADDQRADIDENIELLREELFGQDKEVLEYTYGLNGKPMLNNTEISKRVGVSPSMVTQIKSRIARRLQSSGVLSGY